MCLSHCRYVFVDSRDGFPLLIIFTSVSSVASESGTNLIVLGSFCGLHDGADGFRFLLPTGTIGAGRLNLQTEILNEQGAVEQQHTVNYRKVFQSNGNRPFADRRTGYIVNMSWEVPLVRSKLNKFEHVLGGGTCMVRTGVHVWTGTLYGESHFPNRHTGRQTDRTENITFPQLPWRAVKIIIWAKSHRW